MQTVQKIFLNVDHYYFSNNITRQRLTVRYLDMHKKVGFRSQLSQFIEKRQLGNVLEEVAS